MPMTVRALILRAPGTNCDRETVFAFEQAGARAERVHVNRLLERPALLHDYQIFCLPGGFCYGDDLGAGTILASRLRHHLGDALRALHEAGKLILGICNGFQALVKARLLPGGDATGKITLAPNDSAGFEDRWVHLQAEAGQCVFLRGVERLDLPVAHAEGKFTCTDAQVLNHLQRTGQLVLRYATTAGTETAHPRETKPAAVGYPENPNGSWGDVAGLCDPTGRIFGLMPHPERHVRRIQHPTAKRRDDAPTTNGLAVFRNAVRYFQ